MSNWYITREAVKASMSIPDALDDALIDLAVDSVSRGIDGYCGRWFYGLLSTRLFTAARAQELLLSADLLSITELATDQGGARTYQTVWTPADYDLEPEDAQARSLPAPYDRICVAPLSGMYFPSLPRSTRVIGEWGYSSQTVALVATLAADVNASIETFALTAGGAAEVQTGRTLLVGTERVFVRSVDTTLNTIRVTRHVNGSAAAAHLSGSALAAYEYDAQIAQCARIQAAHEVTMRNAPGGMIGSPDVGMRIVPQWHPLVKAKLDLYRR